MEFSKKLLNDDPLKVWTVKGELLPDPNLIWNIDHMSGFIKIELDLWKHHSLKTEKKIQKLPESLRVIELLKDDNVRIYIKALFDISTYYVACIQAIDRLITQLYNISKHYQLNVKKPKLVINKTFHEKAQIIRDKSFIHQDSSQMPNPMDKRVAMSWTPTLSYKTGGSPTCESYEFGSGKWSVSLRGEKTNSEIDVSISGLTEFATIALEQLDARKSRVISYYDQIKFCRNMHMS